MITKTNPKSPEEVAELVKFVKSCPFGTPLPKSVIDNIAFVMKTTIFVDGLMALWSEMQLNPTILFAVHHEVEDLMLETASGVSYSDRQHDFDLDLSGIAKRRELLELYMHSDKNALDPNVFPVAALLNKK
jgi:hypothetical protein